MSESRWTTVAAEPPTEREELRPLNQTAPEPPDHVARVAEDTPGPETASASDRDEPEATATATGGGGGGGRRRFRFALPDRAVLLKRETRVGIAAAVSILILVAVLAANGGKTATPSREDENMAAKAGTSRAPAASVAENSSPPPPMAPGTAPKPVPDVTPNLDHSLTTAVAQLPPSAPAPVPLPSPKETRDRPRTATLLAMNSPPAEAPAKPLEVSDSAPVLPPTPASAPAPAEEPGPTKPDASAPPPPTSPAPEPPTEPSTPLLPSQAPKPAPEPEKPAPASGSERTPPVEPTKPVPAPGQTFDPSASASPEPNAPAPAPAPASVPTANEAPAPPPATVPEPEKPANPEPKAAEQPAPAPPSNPPASPSPSGLAPPEEERTPVAAPTPSPSPAPTPEPAPTPAPMPQPEPKAVGAEPSLSEPGGSSSASAPLPATRETSSPPQPPASSAQGPGERLPNLNRPPEPVETVSAVSAAPGTGAGAALVATGAAIPNAGKRPVSEPEPAASATSDDGSARPAASVPDDTDSNAELVESVPHVVQRGENFWTISRLYYGSGRFYLALWKANGRLVSAPERLRVGTTIRIPPPEALDRSLIKPPSPMSSNTNSSTSEQENVSGMTIRKTSRPVLQDNPEEDAPSFGRRPSEIDLDLPVAARYGPPAPATGSGRSTLDPDDVPETRFAPRHPIYKVRKFETLRSIARDVLGDAHRARELGKLNEAIIDDPNQLTPGQIIELPDDAVIGRRGR